MKNGVLRSHAALTWAMKGELHIAVPIRLYHVPVPEETRQARLSRPWGPLLMWRPLLAAACSQPSPTHKVACNI